jgi:hypothetical protein
VENASDRPLATRTLELLGSDEPIVVRISQPAADEDGSWFCRVDVDGDARLNLHGRIYGGDAFQALILGLTFIGNFFDTQAEEEDLTLLWDGSSDIGFPTFPYVQGWEPPELEEDGTTGAEIHEAPHWE